MLTKLLSIILFLSVFGQFLFLVQTILNTYLTILTKKYYILSKKKKYVSVLANLPDLLCSVTLIHLFYLYNFYIKTLYRVKFM